MKGTIPDAFTIMRRLQVFGLPTNNLEGPTTPSDRTMLSAPRTLKTVTSLNSGESKVLV